MEPWESAYEDYMAGMKYKDIASKHGVKLDTVKNWKKRKWPKSDTDTKCHLTQKNDTKANQKVSVRPENRSAPQRNTNATTHGLYSKYFPKELMEIMQESSENNLDLLLEKIRMLNAKIIYSFSIQHVKDKDDCTKRIISDGSKGTLYDYKEAFEKDANFLHALSNSLKTLTGMIRQYEDLVARNPEMETELQRARLEKAKAEAMAIKAEIDSQEDTGVQIVIDVPRPDQAGDDDDADQHE